MDSEKVIFRKETEDCNTPWGMRVHFDVTKDEFVLNSRVRWQMLLKNELYIEIHSIKTNRPIFFNDKQQSSQCQLNNMR